MSPQTAGTRVELRLLGGFGLTIDGTPFEVTPAAQRLLAFIALTPRGAERSYTAFQLWPEHDEHRARANLRSALWRLGKAPVDLVAASKTRLRLAGHIWVDVRDEVAELVSGDLDAIARAALPFQVLDADLLPDWYDDWLTIERERLRQFRLGWLDEGARRSLDRGRSHRAVQLALAAVSMDPLRESSHRLVIEAHLAVGNRADAARHYRHCARILLSRTGQAPSLRLRTLVEGIELNDGPDLPHPAVEPGSVAPIDCPALVAV